MKTAEDAYLLFKKVRDEHLWNSACDCEQNLGTNLENVVIAFKLLLNDVEYQLFLLSIEQ